MTKCYPCLLQLKASKSYTTFLFFLLGSSGARSLSIWEQGIAYSPQGHISESAALCETATLNLLAITFIL